MQTFKEFSRVYGDYVDPDYIDDPMFQRMIDEEVKTEVEAFFAEAFVTWFCVVSIIAVGLLCFCLLSDFGGAIN